MTRRTLLFAVVASLCFTLAALCQTGTSQLSGTVFDSSGAVVPGASVTATNEQTGVSYQQVTTEAGLYSFPSISVGVYSITVEIRGFKTARQTGNVLQVNTPMVVDVTLELGETTETVSVSGSYVALQTSSATMGNVVERKAIVELPLNGRNPLNLLVLEPGVVQRSQGAAGSGVHVNGSRDRAFNNTIDGIEANESTVPNPLSNLFRLNPDNVQEFKVTTNNPTAEEGRNSGASVSVATRGGTNTFHGTVYEFFRNTALNANEYFANAQDTPKPDIKLNQYGFEVGGPILKNKTFFFGSWQGQKINFSQPIDQVFGTPGIYTAAGLDGQFRYFVADPKNPLVLDGVTITRNSPRLVDPKTGALRPEVRVCASPTDAGCVATFNIFANDPRGIGADPVIRSLLSSYPVPNSYISGDGLNTATYFWNPPTRVRGPHYMIRIDHVFNESHSLFGRWLEADQYTLDGDPLNGRPQVFPGFPPLGEVFRDSTNLAVGHRWVISPRMVNEFTMGYSRFQFHFSQGEANPAFPDIYPFDFANVSEPFNNRPRTARAVTTPQFLDNFSLVTGSHMFKTGFNFRFYQHNDQRGQPGGVNLTPVLSFSRSTRPPVGFNTPPVATSSKPGINASDNNNLLQAINELVGIPARLSQVFLGDLNADAFLPFRSGDSVTLWAEGQRMKQYNFYVQDEWRIRRNLVLNYGVRWEINPAPTEAGGRVYVPDKSITGSEGLVTFVHAERWYQNNNLGALGPRLGVAYSPGSGGKTVIRGGYGIAFDPISSFQVTAVAGTVPGLTTSCAVIPGRAPNPGCSDVPNVRIAEGFPLELPPPTTKPSSFLTLPATTLGTSPEVVVFDQNLKLPTVHQWSLNIQREMPGGMVAQVGYVGRRGTRLYRAYDVNQINADPILPDFLAMQRNVGKGCTADGSGCPSGVTGESIGLVTSGLLPAAFVNSSTTAGELAQNAAGTFTGRIEQTTLNAGLRPNQQFGRITYIDSGGDSYYHSLQATLRKRFETGLLVALAYTLGKSIDNQSVDPVGATSSGGLSTTNSRTPTDTRDWRQERGRSDFDRRHVFNGAWMYELPFGRGKPVAGSASGLWNHLIGGWAVNGMVAAMSGEPFSVRSGVRTSNYSHESRADLVGELPQARLQEVPGVIGPVVFPDAKAFKIPTPGTNGIGRNMFEAPGYWNVDFGVQKQIGLSERLRLQIRAEMFNALNQANFDNPRDASVGSPSILSTVFGQTCCVTVAPPSTQNIIQTGESARVIQFALKLQF